MNTDTAIGTVAQLVPPNFADFGLDAQILRAISEEGYSQATPIQAGAIPAVLQKRDVMGAAQTGTGKTAAFVLPTLQRLLPLANHSASPARHPIRALILTPTRELADQIAVNASKYARYTPLRTAVVFGGVDIQAQVGQLQRGVEVLIATPGRLLDHIQQKTVNLTHTELLVLDEADRMLDMGFLPDLQRIINLLPANRQTLVFSATFSPEIKKLANSYLRDPVAIEVARQNATAENVTQTIYKVEAEEKYMAVLHLLQARPARQCIIFANSKLVCSRLARNLVRDNLRAGEIHSDKNQTERMQILEAFKNGSIDILVATDVAARGLDISDMPCVINFDLPYNAEDYVHRIGRTGRAGASGEALSLCTATEERLLADIEKLTKKRLQPGHLPNLSAHSTQDSGSRYQSRNKNTDENPWRRPIRPLQPVDPFFTQPYVPQNIAAKGSIDSSEHPTDTSSDASSTNTQRSKQQTATLLSGMRKR